MDFGRRYVFFCFLMCSFIYPVVVAWTWSCAGWLNYVGAGYMDFAGSGIVHMCGGVGGHGERSRLQLHFE